MTDSPLDLSIVVPALDEAASLPELADQIRTVTAEAGYTFEVWFIDDGSTDRTWAVIRELQEADPRFKGLRFRRNYGKSAALAVGFERASGRYVATMDADLQDDPAELPAMIQQIDEGADLVSGWKETRHDPLSKTIPSRFFNKVTRSLSGIDLHDFNCGLKVYRKEVVKSVRVYGELHRYIPLLAKWEGFTQIEEKPVNHRPRVHGVSKFGFERFLRGFLDLITVIFLMRFAGRPMHFFGSLGTLSFIGGFIISVLLSYDKLVRGNPLSDRPLLLLGALLLLVGVQLFLTGFLGELIIRPRMERTRRYDITEVAAGMPAPSVREETPHQA